MTANPPSEGPQSLAVIPKDDEGGGIFLIQGTPHTAEAAKALVDHVVAEGEEITTHLVTAMMNRRDRDTLLLGYLLSQAARRYGEQFVLRVASAHDRSASSLYSYVQVVDKFGFLRAAELMAQTGTVCMGHLTWLAADGRTPEQVERGLDLALAGYSVRAMRALVLGDGADINRGWEQRLAIQALRLQRLAAGKDIPWREARVLQRLAESLPQDGFLDDLGEWLEGRGGK